MKAPRIMLAAGRSGSGKTMITCGLLRALQQMGKQPAAFKCGPDYIDPMFHEQVIGAPSCNLDPFFTEEETTQYLFCKHAAGHDISVLEGVMGYYDGLGGISTKGSAYDLAGMTKTHALPPYYSSSPSLFFLSSSRFLCEMSFIPTTISMTATATCGSL